LNSVFFHFLTKDKKQMTTLINPLSILFKKNLDEFISIWTNDRKDYQIENIKASDVALPNQKKGIDSSKLGHNTPPERNTRQKNRAEQPLEGTIKFTIFLMPLKAFTRSGLYTMHGYTRKANECLLWSYIGFGFYMLLLVLSLFICR
jgi:hypothetical protein